MNGESTHGVVFSDVAPDVLEQLVADVDAVVDGLTPTGEVTASHQAGLQLRSLKRRRCVTATKCTSRKSSRAHWQESDVQNSTFGEPFDELRSRVALAFVSS